MLSTSYSALSRPWPLPVPKLDGRVASLAAAILRRRWVVMAQISESRLRAFQNDFNGKVITPDDPDYERGRSVWNGAINRRPALIARCSVPADVVQAIRFGRDQALEISVRGGGHNFSGSGRWGGRFVIHPHAKAPGRGDPLFPRSAGGRAAGL